MTGKKSSASSGSGSGSSRSGGGSKQSSHSQNTGSGATGQTYQSDYAAIKEGGFRNMNHLMASYGIKPTPDGYEEGKAILDGLKAARQQE